MLLHWKGSIVKWKQVNLYTVIPLTTWILYMFPTDYSNSENKKKICKDKM